MGVVPAWSARPSTTISTRVMPAMAVTDADILMRLLEHGALLDVQLEKGRDVVAQRGAEPGRVAARLGDAGGKAAAVDLARQHFGGEPAGHAAAADAGDAEGRDLLGEEIDDLEVVVEGNVPVAQGAGDFEGGGDAGDAVEAAAIGHGIGMRAEHDGARGQACDRAAADEVAGGVDVRFEPGGGEAADEIVAGRAGTSA